MINKQSLWFLTLFSLVLVLSVYYITMPSELLAPENQTEMETMKNITVEESEILTTHRIQSDENRISQIKDLRMVLTNIEATIDEKNNAYEQLRLIDVIKGKEEKLEEKLKEKYKLKTFINLENNQIRVVVESDKHSKELANDIMRSIQEEFEEKMYISVKFQY